MIRGNRPDDRIATIGMTFVNRDGNIIDPAYLSNQDIKPDLKKKNPQKEPPVMPIDFSPGGRDLLEDGMDLYFIAFPNKPLKRGDTWSIDGDAWRTEVNGPAVLRGVVRTERKYTVLGFENVNGYDCVILERETKISVRKWVKVWMAFDTQSGMLVKLKGETHERLYGKRLDDSSRVSIEAVDYTTIELSEQEQLSPKELAIEQQALNRIQWAMLEFELEWREPPEDVSGGTGKTFWEARKALRERLKQIKAEYPNSRLMPGVVGLITQIDEETEIVEEEESKKIRFKDFLLK